MQINPGAGYTFTSSSSGHNLNIEQPWQNWTNIAYARQPFEIIEVIYDDVGTVWTFQVVPGTINNVVPQIEEDAVWVKLDRTSGGLPDWPVAALTPFNSTTHECFIYLRIGKDATSGDFPSTDDTSSNYPRIICSGTALSDTDTYGYVLLAKATEGAGPVCSVAQYVTGSLWGDRIKLGTNTATYYYARI